MRFGDLVYFIRMLRTLILIVGLLSGMAAAAWEVQTVSGVRTHEPEKGMLPVHEGKARNVILMIGDGMGSEHVWAAWLCNHGKLNLERMPVTGFSRTSSASHTITDSAAGGTAIACGHKAANGQLGQKPDGTPLRSVMQRLADAGRQTGLVVTKSVTDATPASFYAHTSSRRNTEAIAADLVQSGCQVVIGGGAAHVSPQQVKELRKKGCYVDLVALKECPMAAERGNYLSDAVRCALRELAAAPNGFFLMVEASSIDLAGHDNHLRELVEETLDFDRTIGLVMNWMKQHPDTLLIVTADHQTGGLSILDGSAEKGEVKAAFATTKHSGVSVPVYAAGAGASAFGGIQENTDFLNKILKAAGISPGAEPAAVKNSN